MRTEDADRGAGRDRPRYLFIGGLHRSGTSLTARLAAELPGAGGITGAPVPENEGVYLQGAIPHTALLGRPMQFATDPAEHLTEAHPLNTLETKLRLERDWAPWFEDGLRWRVEKSPVNLTRTRLLQQLFPLSQFLIVLRHPEAVAASVAGWTPRPRPDLIDHWIAAHERLKADLPYLHACLVLRYEDITADPGRARARIAAFLSLDADGAGGEPVTDGNAQYAGTDPMSPAQASAAADWGYAPGLRCAPWPGHVRHPLRAVLQAVERA
ncbi:sulfotransferase [Marivita sp. GX14005]|uniref:sulfotransferase family protein n=1 Tax=Marivita sp. GX14005 TaxID=2942276 RepID=UPI002019F312|nr:sulfotransferase [Marivita sp. GX14005]MCL3883918.1 sulfotransferase [Marivita sp. GX14005]